MSLPPESKQKLSTIDKFSMILLIGMLLSPFLFVLQQTYVFLFDDSADQKSSEERKVENNIVAINKIQGIITLTSRKNSLFAKTLDEITYDKTFGWHMSITRIFEYKVDIQSKDLAVIGAKPINQDFHGYNGATLRYKNVKGLIATKSIVCRSKATGADGTDPLNAPVTDSFGKLRCAPSWTVVHETQSEPAKQQETPDQKVDR